MSSFTFAEIRVDKNSSLIFWLECTTLSTFCVQAHPQLTDHDDDMSDRLNHALKPARVSHSETSNAYHGEKFLSKERCVALLRACMRRVTHCTVRFCLASVWAMEFQVVCIATRCVRFHRLTFRRAKMSLIFWERLCKRREQHLCDFSNGGT